MPNDAAPNLALVPYYGGKFRLRKRISIIVQAMNPGIYVEPFCGGASVFLALPIDNKRIEVLNDRNMCLYTLYKTLKRKPKRMKRILEDTLFSYRDFQDAKTLISQPIETLKETPDINIAVATYISLCMSVSNIMGSATGWRFSKTYGDVIPRQWRNKVINFEYLVRRLENVFLDCISGEKCIKRWDHPNTVFYVDPPYPGTHCGHYGTTNKLYSVPEFSIENFASLCELLSRCKGSYILSNYDMNGIKPSNADFEIRIPHHKSKGVKGQEKTEEIIWVRHPNPDQIRSVIASVQ